MSDPIFPSDNTVYHTRYFDILRLDVPGWRGLSDTEKSYLYHLSEACLYGRDIIYLQHHRWGLLVREILEAIWSEPKYRTQDLEEYLAQYWFHSGLYHSYEERKFLPKFSKEWFEKALSSLPFDLDTFLGDAGTDREKIVRFVFDPDFEGIRRTSGDAGSLLERSSVNFYAKDISTEEATAFYAKESGKASIAPGLNTFLYKGTDGKIREESARTEGLYGNALSEIVLHLSKAAAYAPSEEASDVLRTLISYYESGDLDAFGDYSKKWVHLIEKVDMINGFIETYTDPLGLKGSWEGIVELEDEEGTKRTSKIIALAGILEQESPIDPSFKREKIGAVSNRAINVLTLAGDSYPSSPLGINLPNDENIRATEGSKSVTLSNVSRAIHEARSQKSVPVYYLGQETRNRQITYGALADTLHTDLHEGIGHASGRLLEGVTGDALREFDSAIEETRADLNALYFIAHPLLQKEGIIQSEEVCKALYDGYLTRGLLSQLARVGENPVLTQAHMQNRALIGWWTLDLAKKTGAVTMEIREGKHYVFVHDYEEVRNIFGEELKEIQRIKSTGDYACAKSLIEKYATQVDPELLAEIKERDKETGIPPYTGFVNPILRKKQDNGIELIIGEDYFAQNLRYSKDYKTLVTPLSRYKKASSTDEGKWAETISNLRTQLRRLMDGKVAASMRSNGIDWKLNYGANLLKLKELSQSLPKDTELSEVLWGKNIREMRLLALMTMPDSASEALPLRMVTEVRTIEEIEQLTDLILIPMGLAEKAFHLTTQDTASSLSKLLPYILLTRLITLRSPLKEEVISEVERLALNDFRSGLSAVGTYVHRTFTKLAESGANGRQRTKVFALRLKERFGENTSAYAIAEDLDDLIKFLKEEDQNGSQD